MEAIVVPPLYLQQVELVSKWLDTASHGIFGRFNT